MLGRLSKCLCKSHKISKSSWCSVFIQVGEPVFRRRWCPPASRSVPVSGNSSSWFLVHFYQGCQQLGCQLRTERSEYENSLKLVRFSKNKHEIVWSLKCMKFHQNKFKKCCPCLLSWDVSSLTASVVFQLRKCVSRRVRHLFSRHHTQGLCINALGVPQASLQLSVQLHRQLRLSAGRTKSHKWFSAPTVRLNSLRRNGTQRVNKRGWKAMPGAGSVCRINRILGLASPSLLKSRGGHRRQLQVEEHDSLVRTIFLWHHQFTWHLGHDPEKQRHITQSQTKSIVCKTTFYWNYSWKSAGVCLYQLGTSRGRNLIFFVTETQNHIKETISSCTGKRGNIKLEENIEKII